MKSLHNFRTLATVLVVVGTPSYLIYDLNRIAQNNQNIFHHFCVFFLIGLLCLVVLRMLKTTKLNYEYLKPFWERPVALFLLMCSSPVLLISALFIKLESKGPVFYRQIRIGKNRRKGSERRTKSSHMPPWMDLRNGADRRKHNLGGKSFKIYKLRSMRKDAEEILGAAWSTGDADPRVTRAGYYIRKTHVDELPQLLNVLLGQMSIIGPRPERPEFIAKLADTVDDYCTRLSVPAGITGLAQVNQEHDETLEDVKRKLKFDKQYVEEISLLLDLKIIFLTLLLVLRLFWSIRGRRNVPHAEPKPVTSFQTTAETPH